MPLKKFECTICGKKAPKKYLEHGMMEKRMSWLRHHYQKNHPFAFREMYDKKKKGHVPIGFKGLW